MTESHRIGLSEPLLQHLAETQDAAEIERLADDLSELGDPRAATALLARLGEQGVQDDADAEDAVCSALVRFGIMEKLGNLNFRLREASQLPADVSAWIRSHHGSIPFKYLGI